MPRPPTIEDGSDQEWKPNRTDGPSFVSKCWNDDPTPGFMMLWWPYYPPKKGKGAGTFRRMVMMQQDPEDGFVPYQEEDIGAFRDNRGRIRPFVVGEGDPV